MGILGEATDEERSYIKQLSKEYELVDDEEFGTDHAVAIAEMKAHQAEKRSAIIANCEELQAIEAEQQEK